MTREQACTSIDEIESIPQEDLPMLVLSSDNLSFLAWAIRARTTSDYSHLMWLHRPGFFATQDWWYREVPVKKYAGTRLKLWRNKKWTPQQRIKILSKINAELKKPAWQTRYDLLAILGQLLGLVHIQVPWTNICSDWANLIMLNDKNYDLNHPSPGDVNDWLKTRRDYECFTRYIPD
jgi:hypothetical protein